MTFLFTLEGIDGSGKSTLISNLKTLPNLNLVTSSWRDTELGKKIWCLLNKSKVEKKESLPSGWSCIFLIFVAFDELKKK